jgi:anti-sigma B factor antagonist
MDAPTGSQRVGSKLLITMEGDLDIYTGPSLRQEAIGAMTSEGCYDVLVNLEGVDFLDSAGLGILVGLLKRARVHGGNLSLICPRPGVLRILEVTRLASVFAIYGSRAEATR